MTPIGFDNYLTMTINSQVNDFEVFYREVAGADAMSQFIDAEAVSPNCTLLRPFIKHNDWTKFFVHVGRQLAIGEYVTVQFVEHYSEPRRDREYRHSYSVIHPVRRLELTVEFMDDELPREAWWRKYIGDSGDVADGGPIRCDGYNAELSIEKPEVGYNYALHWSYES